MTSIWQSYIPDYLVQSLLENPAQLVGREQRFESVVLFADVSGFTAISEALGKSGRSGTEELTTILNSYFEPMIELIRSYGGIIGKFGGDAMTVLFPYTIEEAQIVIHQAVQCALDMQAKMVDYRAIPTSAGAFELAMKAGLAAGPLFCTTVGDPEARLEYIIAGTSLDLCADAEHHASRGEVVIHNHLLELAGGIVASEERDGFLLVERVTGRTQKRSASDFDQLPPETIQTISAFLHPSISQRVREGLSSFINEHRKVTVLFVRFDNLDYDHDPNVGEKLQDYFAKVIETVQSYDGYLNKIDMGDKGSKYIIVFGAPIAHEDDVERALQCALDLQEIPDFSVRIGVNSGFVYCGLVGSPARQEYTVMGDVVNLSARLMQAAQSGQILISEDTYIEGEGFTWISLPSIQVKGKTEAVTIRQLMGEKKKNILKIQERQYILPMVGRVKELQAAHQIIQRTLQGRGQVFGITAEAGMGKSRLVAEIIRLARESGLDGYGGECVSHGTKISYLVWQNLLTGFFELDSNDSLESQIRQLESHLHTVNPNFDRRTPLLRQALNLKIEDNAITVAMDARMRKASLENLLVDCIRLRAGQTPIFFVLEDCHWIDPVSNDLLEVLARNIADVPVLILVVYRPAETEQIQPRVSQFAHFSEISLAEFTPEEAAQLIQLKLEQLFHGVDVSSSFVERITEQAGGNPFFVDEMINLLHDRGIDPADSQTLETLILPDSLNSLIISRIDQLAEGPKTTLKIASVIGRLFKASWLWGIYPQLGSPDQIKLQLEHLNRLEITPLDKPEPELEYLFKHILTREVAYESLAVSTRQMLHEQIGSYIERDYPNNLDQFLNILAYHYGASQNTTKQREYFHKAGIAAQETFANEAAIDYFRRLLPLLPDKDKIEILLRLGDVLQLIGNWSDTEQLFRQAMEISEKIEDPRELARARRAYGDILSRKGTYDEALSWLEKAKTTFKSLNDLSGLEYTLRLIGVIHWRQGDYDPALRCFEQCHQISTDIGNLRGAYRAIGNMGLIYYIRGEYDRALEAYGKGQQIAQNLGDRLGEGIIAGNIGNVYLVLGDYSKALENYFKSLQFSLEIGDRQGVGLAVGNIGNIYWYTGDFLATLRCHAMHLQISLELGEQWGVSLAASKIALAYMAQGNFDESEVMLKRAIILGQVMDSLYELSGFYFDWGNLLSAQGKLEKALDSYNEAVQLAAEADNSLVQFEAQVARMRTQVQLGQKNAETAIEQLHHLHDAWMEHFHGNEEQEAAIHYEIWKLDPTQEHHLKRAGELYAHLYEHTPSAEFRERYHELAGEHLPDPPPLPPLPDIVTRKSVNLDALIDQIDALIQEAQAASHDGHDPHH